MVKHKLRRIDQRPQQVLGRLAPARAALEDAQTDSPLLRARQAAVHQQVHFLDELVRLFEGYGNFWFSRLARKVVLILALDDAPSWPNVRR